VHVARMRFRFVPILIIIALLLAACEAPGFIEHTWQLPDETEYRSLLVAVNATRDEGLLAPLPERSTYTYEEGEPRNFTYALPPVASPNNPSYLIATGPVSESDGGAPQVAVRYSAVDSLIPEMATTDAGFTVNDDGTVDFAVTVLGEVRGGQGNLSATKLVIGVMFVDLELNPLAAFVDDTQGSHAMGERWTYRLENVPVDPAMIANNYRVYAFDASALPAETP